MNKPNYCRCNCGGIAKPGNKYILGHNSHVAWNKGLTKETDKRIKEQSELIKGHISWNKDLTKETDVRVRKQGKSISKSFLLNKTQKGENNSFYGKHHSEERKRERKK